MNDIQLIFNAFRQLVRALRLNSGQIEKETGLTGAQLFVLQKIASGEATSVNEIAARTQTDQSSVSVVIQKLTKKKLLIRKTDPKDLRKSLLSITPLGLKIVKSKNPLVQDRLLEAIESLSSKEQKDLSRLLTKIGITAQINHEPATLFFEEESKTNAKRLPKS